AVPPGAVRVLSPETIWHRFLAEKYGNADAVNAAHGTRYAWIAEAPWPQPEIDRLDWEQHRLRYMAETAFQNYRRAWELMTEASPALVNTLRFALLFTLCAVVVNTGAGYALSRFSLGRLQLSLVLFLALGAFPLEALAVPNFLLLREYGLLNTVWALALPTAVNGYYIYLMKGFFDAVPRAYLETATMEGAGEWGLFVRVSLPLARPMIAVVALYSFLWSYANFMWAFIVCQQRTEWTLPVLLYSMATWAAAPVLAAGAVAALLPPLLVFAVAHRTLQRGLSLPRV
ncbi:MAG: carbohydrate ABC transporter permease, partial [bacterium]